MRPGPFGPLLAYAILLIPGPAPGAEGPLYRKSGWRIHRPRSCRGVMGSESSARVRP